MNIIKMLCPESKYSIKAPYEMVPQGITIHNTANDACAIAEISYMISNNYKVSYHWAVDDVNAVQGLPHNRNAWHAGDGSKGFGNRHTIGIEICYSKSGGDKFLKAEDNAAELIARLMLQYGWGLDKLGLITINTHQSRSGKYCPHKTLDLGMDRFYDKIRVAYSKLSGEPIPEPQPLPVGAYTVQVKVNALNIRAGAGTNYDIVGVIRDKGTYTIVETQGNWGKLKSNVGWICLDYVNVKCDEKPNPEPTTKFNIGDEVIINGKLYNSSNADNAVGSVSNKRTKITRISKGAKHPYNTTGDLGWMDESSITKASEPPRKTPEEVAKEILYSPNFGGWGTGEERRNKLIAAGYNPDEVQNIINQLAGGGSTKPIEVGDRVQINGSAQKYTTGEKIPQWVKNNKYKVIQRNGNKVLLDSIMSWVYVSDVHRV